MRDSVIASFVCGCAVTVISKFLLKMAQDS